MTASKISLSETLVVARVKNPQADQQTHNGSDGSIAPGPSTLFTVGDAPSLTRHSDSMLSDDESSVVSTSSEEPSSDSDEESDEEEHDDEGSGRSPLHSDERLTVRGMPKPVMRFAKSDRERSQSLRDRLKEFLPKLAAANEELERERAVGTLERRNIENVDEREDAQYIEMNLGLGVLELKDPNAANSDSHDNDDGNGRNGNADNDDSNSRENDIMGELMGHKRDGAGIQIVEEKK